MSRLGRTCRSLAALAALFSLAFPNAAVAAPAPQAAPLVVSVDVSGNAHVPSDRILSVVQTVVMLLGGLDISVSSQAGLTSVVSAMVFMATQSAVASCRGESGRSAATAKS